MLLNLQILMQIYYDILKQYELSLTSMQQKIKRTLKIVHYIMNNIMNFGRVGLTVYNIMR